MHPTFCQMVCPDSEPGAWPGNLTPNVTER